MFDGLKSLFARPTFAEARRTRAAQLNRTILLFILTAVCVLLLAFPLVAPENMQRALLLSPLVPLLLLLLWLNRRGRIEAAGNAFAVIMMLLLLGGGVTAGGVRTPAYVFTILVVIIAGFLLSRGLGVAFALLTVVNGLGLLLAERAGLLPPPIVYSSTALWVLQSVAVVTAALILQLARQSMEESVERSERDQAALRQSLVELSHSQRLLLALSQAGESIGRARSAPEIYTLVGQEISALGQHAVILEREPEGEQLRVVHHTFDPNALRRAHELTGLDLSTYRIDPSAATIIRRLATEREPVFEPITSGAIADVLPAGLRRLAGRLAAVLGLQETIGAPLIVAGALHGLLFVVGRDLSQGDVTAVSVLAKQIGVALEQATLLQAIQEQAERLQRILAAVPEGLLVLDAECRIQMANAMGQTLLRQLAGAAVGERLSHLGGQPLTELLVAADDEQAWRELAPADSNRIYELGATRLDYDRQQADWVLILRDVTDERTRQRYQQAQERLATVGQLAAGVAHDFNNIMAIITLYAQLLLRSPALNPTDRERLNTIQQQADRAASLIGQILDFSRRSVLEFAPVRLGPFLKELLKLLERTFPENIRFRLEAETSQDTVHADPARLQQVFLNLCVNARDAMPRGGSITIQFDELRLEPGALPPLPGMNSGDWLRILMVDDGLGIAAEHLPHVFEPFFSTKPTGQGTGLGLAQAYGIVKQHGGHIDVASAPGEGTTFSIFLPAVAAGEAFVAEAVGEAEVPAAGQDQLILVVEDDPAARRAVGEALLALGYRVLEAEDGATAVRLFAQHGAEIALVVSDLVMPDLGGEALYRALRRQRPGVRMVMMTGYPAREKSRAFRDGGGVTWIAKPFTLQTIAAAVQGALGDAP